MPRVHSYKSRLLSTSARSRSFSYRVINGVSEFTIEKSELGTPDGNISEPPQPGVLYSYWLNYCLVSYIPHTPHITYRYRTINRSYLDWPDAMTMRYIRLFNI